MSELLSCTFLQVSLQRQKWLRGGTVKPHVYLTATPVYIAQKVERVALLQFSPSISPKAEMTAGGTVKPHVYLTVTPVSLQRQKWRRGLLLNVVFIWLQLQYLSKGRHDGAGVLLNHVYRATTPVYIAQKVERVAQLQFSSSISLKAEMTAGGYC